MLKKFIFFYLIFGHLALGYINIYPPFFYEKLDNNNQVFKTLVLTNTRDFPIRYRLYLEEDSLTDIDVDIYPKGVTLKPFEKEEIKVLVKASKKLNKEFTKTLVIKEVELPGETKKILTMFKLKLSGFSGELEPQLLYENGEENSLKVTNIGERVGIYNLYNSKEEFIDSFILKKGESKEFQLSEDILIFEEKFQGKEKMKRGINNES